MIIIKQFEDESILVVDTASLKAKLWIKNLWYFATEVWLPWTATNWDYAIVWSTDTVWVWDSDTNAWKNTDTTSTWDMMKSVYDTNNDWKVDAADVADSVEWTWVQNKPTTFTPTAHNHNDLYYTDVAMDILLNWKQPLSSILSNTTASYTTTIDTRLANTSWTNTWDNATNTQYSWLATSKQDTLVSWTNIKTVNWTSLLWSWNISISWWGGGWWDMLKSENLSWLANYTTARSNLWLWNVDNTSDINKPISTATQTALDWKVDENTAITWATKTKITYDSKWLVTAWADLIESDIPTLSQSKITNLTTNLGNKQPLATVLTNTTASYTTTIDTRLANTSWTNTWDNATNSQYSWLATSKQDTLVSWTNIKTVNWTSLLWSWNIVISGWSSAIRRILTVWWTIWTIWTNVWPELTIDWTYTISQINLSYWTSGNWTLTVDINKNGTTLFATTKPSITWTNKYSINTWTLTTTSLASGDILTIDIDAVPWTPWTDLYIEIIYS